MSAAPSYSRPFQPYQAAQGEQYQQPQYIDVDPCNLHPQCQNQHLNPILPPTPSQFSNCQTQSQSGTAQAGSSNQAWQGGNSLTQPRSLRGAPRSASSHPNTAVPAHSSLPEHHKKAAPRHEASQKSIQRMRKQLDTLEAAIQVQTQDILAASDSLEDCKASRQMVADYNGACEQKLEVWNKQSKDSGKRLMRLKGELLSDLPNAELEQLSEELSMGRQALIIEQSNRGGDERPKAKPKRVIEFFHEELPSSPGTIPKPPPSVDPEKVESIVKSVAAETAAIQKHHTDNVKEFKAKEQEFVEVKTKLRNLQECYKTRRKELERAEKWLDASLKEADSLTNVRDHYSSLDTAELTKLAQQIEKSKRKISSELALRFLRAKRASQKDGLQGEWESKFCIVCSERECWSVAPPCSSARLSTRLQANCFEAVRPHGTV
eukprot:GHVN01067287.1.p1 GENE.GHVN01067287.1~~GHVN01067287.1.p1  ORF type:complete len:434 (-),score=43.58 GHVN01067287.1:2940-4241(-)